MTKLASHDLVNMPKNCFVRWQTITLQKFMDYDYDSDVPRLLTDSSIKNSFIETDTGFKINEDQIGIWIKYEVYLESKYRFTVKENIE